MNNYALEQAEELFEQALEYFLGIEKEKNMIHAKELLQQSSELGLSKSSNLLGDWYIKKIIPGDNYKEAFKLYTRGCEFGDMRSFSRLAMCYEKGYGIKKDIPKALELYEKSVELGNKDACFSIARIYEKGENIKMDLSKAILWYKRGYEKGDADCACNLATCYYKGKGIEQNIEKAKEIFLAFSEYNTQNQRNLGVIFYKGTPSCKPNEEEAIYWFTKAANNGDITSMLHLGKIYKNLDKEKAMEWYRKAGSLDHKKAAYSYAFHLYQYKIDWNESFKWMKCSAENKHVPAQFLLGLFYKCGIGTPVAHDKAFYWFNIAAENGYEQSYSHIGRYYRDERIIKIDYENALFWFEKAIASQNINVRGEALYDYGVMYLDGLGVKKNKIRAIGYLLESKELGCINAINKLKELDSDIISNENINNSRIIEHGNIIEYVEMKVNDGYESANWVENIVPKLNIYIECAKQYGLVGKNSEEKWFWKLSNKDFAQWVLDVSDDLKLYTTNERNQRKYYPYYFANLFLTKKGIKFKSEDLRHNMSAINTSINGKEVRNIKPLIAVRGIARREIKAKSL